MHEHSKEDIKQICEFMGENINAPVCREMLEHLNDCPTCKVFYDTVKKTVILCRDNECPEKLPDDVRFRLMKSLDISEYIR